MYQKQALGLSQNTLIHLVVKPRHNLLFTKSQNMHFSLKTNKRWGTHVTLDTIQKQYTKYHVLKDHYSKTCLTRTISEYNDYCKRFGQVDLDFIEQELTTSLQLLDRKTVA